MPDLSMQKPLLAFSLLKLLTVYDEYTRHGKKAITICYLNTNVNENLWILDISEYFERTE